MSGHRIWFELFVWICLILVCRYGRARLFRVVVWLPMNYLDTVRAQTPIYLSIIPFLLCFHTRKETLLSLNYSITFYLTESCYLVWVWL